MTVFSQPPDFGNALSNVGNKAKKPNGIAKAIEKPSIPSRGAHRPPEVTLTSKKPIIGPVQENDTITNTNDIKNMLIKPVVDDALASILDDHDAGSVISNAPKNEMANTTNKAKRNTLNIALVDSELSALGPNMSVMSRPSITYMMIMPRP